MNGIQELPDGELVAYSKEYKTPKCNLDTIRKYFVFMGDDAGESEWFECRHCNRRFSTVEVFCCVDPYILTEHPAKGFPFICAEFGNAVGQYWMNQCAVREEIK